MTVRDPSTVCGAKTKAGTPCQRPAGWGTSHPGTPSRCKLHGGASPQAELAGQVALARHDAMVMGNPLPIEPGEAILQCIAIAAGEVRYATERIAELGTDEAAGPVVTTHVRPLSLGKEGEDPDNLVTETRHLEPALNIWIVTRRAAMDRLVQYSVAALKAGVEERRVRIAETVGQALADAMRGVLVDLGVADHPKAAETVRKHLTLMAGTG